MKTIDSILRLAVAGLSVLAVAACQHVGDHCSADADMLFVNGSVYTVDEQRSVAEAAAISDGRIVFVGTETDAQCLVGAATRVIDMKGGMLLPGFTDAHVHIRDGGETLNSLSLYDAESQEELTALIQQYVTTHPDLEVISGAGWQLSVFPGANPHKSILDAIESERPIILESADGHNSWVNSKALELAGITKDTPDPGNGRIERDAETGEATGTLREGANGLVDPLVPELTLEAAIADLKAGQAYENRHGFTAAIDAAVRKGVGESAFVRLAEEGGLTLRTRLSLLPADDFTDSGFSAEMLDERIQALDARRERVAAAGSELLSANMVKIFLDGVLENHTGALLEPYVGAPGGPDQQGKLNMAGPLLNTYVTRLDAAGFDVHMHAIGDRAVRAGLDAAAAARTANGERDRRIHIAHLELIDPADIPRFRDLDVYANIQTLWAYADEYITDLTEPFIGPQRSRWLYPNRSLRDAGATLVSGSDWPVSSSNPFEQMETAVTRKDSRGGDAEAWIPEETLTVDDMITALTINGARLMRQDGFRGSIEVGKVADLVLVSADPFQVPAEDLSEISVWLTLVAGNEVYRAEGH